MQTITINSSLPMPIGETHIKDGKEYKVVDNFSTVQVTLEETGKCLVCNAFSCDHQEINPETGEIER